MSIVIKTIESEPITLAIDSFGQEVIQYKSKAAIDDDGSINLWHDPCWQPETSLRLNGKYIDAEKVPYIAVPPAIIYGAKRIVLGSTCLCFNSVAFLSCLGVVAEIGPRDKLGELSVEMARRLALNPSAISGGTSDHVIKYTIWPGKPAVVDRIVYQLQAAAKRRNG